MNIYHYLYYRIYKFWERFSVPKFWSDWKAELSMDVLLLFVLFSGLCYYTSIIERRVEIDTIWLIISYLIVVALPNYFVFHSQDQWKEIVIGFEARKMNNRNADVAIIVFLMIVIANLGYSIYLLSQTKVK